jgi:hypothetical protein
MLVCTLWVRRIHKSYVWPHISSLSVYPFTDTRSRMFNMFCIKRVHKCEKRSNDEKAHVEYVFGKSSRSIMVFLSLIVKTKKQNMAFSKLPKRSPFPENGKKEVC